jgi:hypothetical protein
MLQPDFDPAPTTVRIHRCKCVTRSKKRRCSVRATLIAEKTDAAGRHLRQIELCSQHCEIVIERERSRGLEIWDSRLAHSEAGTAIRIVCRQTFAGTHLGKPSTRNLSGEAIYSER